MNPAYFRSLLFIFMLSNSFTPLVAQINFGLKSGINISTTRNIIAFPQNKLAWYGGAFMEIPLNEKLYIQLDFLYSIKGFKTKALLISNTEYIVEKQTYLNVPILLGFNINKKTSLLFGPEPGYRIGARNLYFGNNIDVSKNYVPKFDIGLDVGLKYALTNNIGFEARYSYGFNTFYYLYASGERGETKGANRVFQIGGKYVLNSFFKYKKSTK